MATLAETRRSYPSSGRPGFRFATIVISIRQDTAAGEIAVGIVLDGALARLGVLIQAANL